MIALRCACTDVAHVPASRGLSERSARRRAVRLDHVARAVIPVTTCYAAHTTPAGEILICWTCHQAGHMPARVLEAAR